MFVCKQPDIRNFDRRGSFASPLAYVDLYQGFWQNDRCKGARHEAVRGPPKGRTIDGLIAGSKVRGP
jgi:hypothetical protein